MNETGIVASVKKTKLKLKVKKGDAIVRVDPLYFRPTKVETLLGHATKRAGNWAGNPALPSQNWFRK